MSRGGPERKGDRGSDTGSVLTQRAWRGSRTQELSSDHDLIWSQTTNWATKAPLHVFILNAHKATDFSNFSKHGPPNQKQKSSIPMWLIISIRLAMKWSHLLGQSVYVHSQPCRLHSILSQINVPAKTLLLGNLYLFNECKGQKALRAVFLSVIAKQACCHVLTCQGASLRAENEYEQQ